VSQYHRRAGKVPWHRKIESASHPGVLISYRSSSVDHRAVRLFDESLVDLLARSFAKGAAQRGPLRLTSFRCQLRGNSSSALPYLCRTSRING
jgi:hypothetical protein